MKQKHRGYGYLVLFLVLAVIVGSSFFFPQLRQFASPAFVREYLLGFGIFSYPLFILLVALSIPLPIPSTAIILGGGYLYGTVLGSVLSLVAIALGSTLAFYLVRSFGKPLLTRLVDEHHLQHFNHVFKRRGVTAAFISYAIPIFPSDMVSLVLGLTKIKYRTFIVVAVLGHIPRLLIINALGEDLFAGFTWMTLFILLLSAVLIIIGAFRERLKRFFFKELKELEKEVKVVEKEVELVEDKAGLKKKKRNE